MLPFDEKKSWQLIMFLDLLFSLFRPTLMSYLVHVGLNAAHKERVRGAECGHQGVQRVLEQGHSTMVSNRHTVKMTLTW